MKTHYLIKIALILIITKSFGQNGNTKIVGNIVDPTGIGLPFVTVSIPELNKGTISNENGEFELQVKPEDSNKQIKFEMMGFKNSLITIAEFLKLENKTLTMKESAAEELDEVLIEQDRVIGKKAIDFLKQNLIDKKHKMAGVYKRATIEDNKAVHLIEHLVYLEDKAGYKEYSKLRVVGARESLDYRKKKVQQKKHAVYIQNDLDPLRIERSILKNINWKNIGDTEIDDRFIVILEGSNKKYKNIKLYVDPKEYKIYQLEYKTSALYYMSKYKTNQSNKMYLNYHRRIFGWNKLKEFNPNASEKTNGVIFKHEFITLKLKEDNYKYFNSTTGTNNQDLTTVIYPIKKDFGTPYHYRLIVNFIKK